VSHTKDRREAADRLGMIKTIVTLAQVARDQRRRCR
jgi:hypothetical protein